MPRARGSTKSDRKTRPRLRTRMPSTWPFQWEGDIEIKEFLVLVLSFFINPIGVSDQAWGTIVTFTVRVLVPGP